MNEDYILIITNKADVTTDFIVKRLTEIKVPFYRLNTEDLLKKNILNFDFDNNSFSLIDLEKKLSIDLLKVKSVYFRRPQMPEVLLGDKLTTGEIEFVRTELAYTLEGLYKVLRGSFWISSVDAIREAENKIYQLQLAKSIGFKIPPSLITNDPIVATQFNANHTTIIKPIKSGLLDDSDGDKVIFTSKVKDFEAESNRIKACSTYFQKFIDKAADIRVTVVGDKTFPALIESQEFSETQVDWRRGENIKLNYKKIVLPEHIELLCLLLTRKLRLKFGAIDLVIDKLGNYYFLEINPNGQWAWIEKQLDYNISEEIVNLLHNGNVN